VRDRYTILVGVFFVAVIAVAFLNRGSAAGSWTLGLDPAPRHWALPGFAVPLAVGDELEGDANVAQDDCETSAFPCPAGNRRTPACRLHLADSFQVCDLFDRPSVISFWFTKGDGCVEQQDVVQRAYERYRGRVGFLSLDVRDDPGKVRDLVSERGWKMPVGYDRDGAVGALYHVGGCPTLAYVYPGGTLEGASIGDLTSTQLEAKIERLLAATHQAERGEG
jgi:hypothetical protein